MHTKYLRSFVACVAQAGIDVPEDCIDVELSARTDSIVVFRFIVPATDETLRRFASAVSRFAEIDEHSRSR